ncbi:acetyltransferase [Vibrio parahaemolyticus]|uniref:acetyltransferase n=1 Tax=Vibrio parahaemolyticus TaxID=670 RepID=UPI000826C174|nr:acetyltransferase [Vibrio parahaemolyticus]EGR2781498.1 acetyltransferase [Vibrio parahaemolyticus]EHH2506029.1 acetyltransferase [Vibrio parahaemolyticus]EIZ1328118.1 acetyltransferase [Vibrio parahaemolyticus]EJB5623028.1 acetyltransferase [Vibrio parahaemolyticus]EJC6730394.1 acetyltransferase [Vibrio parahaemolyticus]
MSKSLIIVGASGLGKEVAWLAKRLGIDILGFLDDREEFIGCSFYHYPVLNTISNWSEYKDCYFSVAIASPRVRKKIVEKMKLSDEPKFVTLIDPSVVIEEEVDDIGLGSIICAGSVITADVIIGEFVIVNKLVSVGHDVTINDFCTISPKVMLGGNANILTGTEIGASSSIRQGLSLGEGSVVGMGSTVVKNVDSNSLYFGSPAKKVKELSPF